MHVAASAEALPQDDVVAKFIVPPDAEFCKPLLAS